MPPPDPPADGRLHTLVLAAGRGNRMGGPKALMTVEGEPWWRTQSRRLLESGLEATWVVSPDVCNALRNQPSAPASMVTADPDAPMFTSILAGVRTLADLTPRGLFILPVDTPAPARRVWSAIAGTDRPRIPSCRGKHGHPVFVPWSIAETVLSLSSSPSLKDGPARLDRIIAPTAEVIEVDDPAVCINLNTPTDIDRYLASKQSRA